MKAKRVYFSVAAGDKKTLEWIEAQSNLSMSLRIVIGDIITRYGMDDISLLPLLLADNAKVSENNVVTEAPVTETEKNETAAVQNVQSNDTFVEEKASEPIKAEEPVKKEENTNTSRVNSMLDDLMG